MLFQILFYTIYFYFLIYTWRWILALFLGRLSLARKEKTMPTKYNNLIVLIPAYKPSETLIKVLKSLFEREQNINVFVLFQEADPQIIAKARKFPIYSEEKSFTDYEGNPYHHALRYAVSAIRSLGQKTYQDFSHLILLDKDNIVHDDFLKHLSKGAAQGFDIVQGRRVPHQTKTVSECYDAISEAMNDWMFRRASMVAFDYLELSGSGVAFDFQLFANAVQALDPRAPGMDKNVMIQLLTGKKKVSMLYSPEAIVYDEKTASVEALQQQRTRWFGNQYFNAFYHGLDLLKASFQYRRFAAFDYLLTLWRPPRSLHIFVIAFFFLLEIVTQNSPFTWSYTVLFFTLGNLNFISSNALWFECRKIILYLPKIVLNNMKSIVLGMTKKSQGRFIHTVHK